MRGISSFELRAVVQRGLDERNWLFFWFECFGKWFVEVGAGSHQTVKRGGVLARSLSLAETQQGTGNGWGGLWVVLVKLEGLKKIFD